MGQAAELRAKAKAKAERLVRNDPHAIVDASSYRPPGALDGDVQTGLRPLSRRAFKSGGKVLGDILKARADRKPRATGGRALVDDFINRNVKDANDKRPGAELQHGGFARGGHVDEAQDRALIHKMGCKCARCNGGRIGRASGGRNWIAGAIKHPGALHRELHVPQGEKIPAKKFAAASHSDNPKLARRANLAKTLKGLHKSAGGALSGGTRPAGGRLARRGGGRAKKGMNVNIIIAPAGGNGPRPMPAPGVLPPGAGPVGLHQGAPPPMTPPSVAAPPPMGPPMRKEGGRVGTVMTAKPKHPADKVDSSGHIAKPGSYPLDKGGGGGKGRLEKIKAYG